MPITDLEANTWENETLTADELWQAREGVILTSLEAGGADDRGIELIPGSVREFSAGQTVYFRSVVPTGMEKPARLARDPR
ncbi:MAG: hypothetical protein N4A53_08150 [Pelagimonas sp.]|jgi:hypothetical protein|nr:hypothetical protein [Pelagimonas sp.]